MGVCIRIGINPKQKKSIIHHIVHFRIQADFSPHVVALKTDILRKLKDLNVPEHPKKPPNPYIMFVKEIQPQIVKENPNIKNVDIFRKCAELWSALDTEKKAKYGEIYKKLQSSYDAEMIQFQSSLSVEQKDALDSLASAKRKDRQDRIKKKV